jgi:hypothetical protein
MSARKKPRPETKAISVDVLMASASLLFLHRTRRHQRRAFLGRRLHGQVLHLNRREARPDARHLTGAAA